MPKIIVKQPFTYYHGGHARRDYVPAAEPVDTDDDCSAVAIAEGWASLEGSAERKNMAAAPENKDAAPKREKKAARAAGGSA